MHPRIRFLRSKVKQSVAKVFPAVRSLGMGPPPKALARHPLYTSRRAKHGYTRILSLGRRGDRGHVLLGRWTCSGQSIFNGFHSNDLITVGSFCSIEDDVMFLVCPGHHFSNRAVSFPMDKFFFEPQIEEHCNFTRIGNDVWIGSKSMLLPGIQIGNGARIEPGSVVFEDVPAYSVVAGNPARFIRWRFDDEDLRNALQTIAWWEWPDAIIAERKDFFYLPADEAVALARERGWNHAEGVPVSYLPEVVEFFPCGLEVSELEACMRRFLYRDNSAFLMSNWPLVKSLAYENLAVWIAMLRARQPQTIVEFGTQSGVSSTLIARLCRFLGLRTRIVTINIVNELLYPDPDVEYVIDDFTGHVDSVWGRWSPDVIFQDAHMYALIKDQIEVGQKHPSTLHLFHDVGHRMFQNPMRIPLDAMPSSATGSWERHVLGLYGPDLLNIPVRHYQDDRMKIHIFDSTADPFEYGIGVLQYTSTNGG